MISFAQKKVKFESAATVCSGRKGISTHEAEWKFLFVMLLKYEKEMFPNEFTHPSAFDDIPSD